MCQRVRLYDWAESPTHLQFNRFILTGYRPLTNIICCVKSLVYLHNELVNVYTHGNVIYHLFMSHAGGAVVYKKLLQLDMCGIWTANTFGVLSTFAASFQDTVVLSWLVPIVYLLLSTFSIHKAVTSKCQSDRVLAFLSPVIYRWTVVTLRVFGKIGGNPFANYYLVWMEVLAAAGAIINVCRIPERWLPGRFDYVMNSHQIMHILSFIALINSQWGAMEDLAWMSRTVS
ncbi:progestin and adipoQ receptor family member 4-like [Saccoglossus kowalevskii]